MEARVRKYVAEFVGTFALIFIGSMAAAIAFEGQGPLSASIVMAGLAHGLTLLVMVYAIGAISGCHINPAVTIALALLRKISIMDAAGYIVFQLAGGIVGSALHQAVRAKGATNLGATSLGSGVGEGAGFLLEAILTFLLVTVIIGAAVSGKAPAGFHGVAIGLTLAAAWIVGGSLTGASLNPARTLGPAVMTGDFSAHWVYWAGPIAGAAVAALVGWYLFLKDAKAPA